VDWPRGAIDFNLSFPSVSVTNGKNIVVLVGFSDHGRVAGSDVCAYDVARNELVGGILSFFCSFVKNNRCR
jgi:hypothetical protein